MTGVISGIRDEYDGSIGMLVVAVKEEERSLEKKEVISDFFKYFSFQCCIHPPKLPIGSIMDLTMAKVEGLSTIQDIEKKFQCKININ